MNNNIIKEMVKQALMNNQIKNKKLNEGRPISDFDSRVKKFVKHISDTFDYSDKDAVYSIIQTLNRFYPEYVKDMKDGYL